MKMIKQGWHDVICLTRVHILHAPVVNIAYKLFDECQNYTTLCVPTLTDTVVRCESDTCASHSSIVRWPLVEVVRCVPRPPISAGSCARRSSRLPFAGAHCVRDGLPTMVFDVEHRLPLLFLSIQRVCARQVRQ
jgi:hypothetical protein